MDFKKIKTNLLYTSLVLASFFNTRNTLAQCNESGAVATIVRNFGAGTDQYSTTTPLEMGFTTTYKQVYGLPRAGGDKDWIVDGEFAIINSTEDPWSMFNQGVIWHAGESNHTDTPGGYMMAVNASFDPGVFYKETVSGLCTGVTYDFSVWIANLDYLRSDRIKPDVRFEIRNAFDNSLISSYETGDLENHQTLTWEQHSLTFDANVDEVILLLINNNSGGAGNDLLLDDISFKPCLPQYQISSSKTTYCVGDQLELTANDAGVGYFTPEYLWQKKDPATKSWKNLSLETNATLTKENISLVDSGWYKVYIAEKGIGASIQCRSEDSFYVSIDDILIPGEIINSQSVCYNSLPSSINNFISASGGNGNYTYFWEATNDSTNWNKLNKNTLDLSFSSPLKNSTAYRRGVQSSCFTAYSDTILITVFDRLIAGTIDKNQIVCSDSIPKKINSSSLPSGGSNNFDYSWESSLDQNKWNAISTATNTHYQAGKITQKQWFRRVEKDAICGTRFSDTVFLEFQQTLPPNTNNIQVCQNELLDDLQVTGSDLLWYTSDNAPTGKTAPPTINTKNTGLTTIFVSTTENTCESEKATIQIDVYPKPQLTANKIAYCEGNQDTIITSVSGGNGNYSYLWSPSTGLTSTTSPQNVISINTTTNYQIVVLDDNSCSDTVIATVTVHDNPQLNINGGDVCSGQPTTLSSEILKSTGAIQYEWAPNTNLSSANTSSVIATPPTTTTYGLTVTDANNCSNTATYKVGVTETPMAKIEESDTVICFEEILTLTAFEDPNQAYSFEWFYGYDTESITPINTNKQTLETSEEGYYFVKVRNFDFCSITSTPVYVKVEEVEVDAFSSEETVLEGEEFQVWAISSANAEEYTWQTPSGEIFEPKFNETALQTFTYDVEAVGQKCSDKDTITVNVLPKIIIPNGFSPNGDQKNDTWFIQGLQDYPKAQLYIYNRWGALVFKNIGPYTNPWRGVNQTGSNLPEATYYYILESNDPLQNIYKGDVTIIR